ncbi:MAG: heat-inducible transcription repressor HrcA [bacterium]|nr:MAG: heat-inducible transcription repressor HrcA [bacterium]
MDEKLTQERHRNVLMAVIHTYIAAAEPVGSKTVADRYQFGLSPATIRHVMAELEEAGFLAQPHTSAGRIPTEKAYRFYVDLIKSAQEVSDMQVNRFRDALMDHSGGVEGLLRKTSKMLSNFSHYTGIALPPGQRRSVFRRVSFVRIGPGTILAVLVSLSGVTQNRLVKHGEDFSQDALDSMSRFLTDRFRGMGLEDMRRQLVGDIRKDRENFDRTMTVALQLAEHLFEEDETEDIYVEGSSNILDLPEFSQNLKKMRHLLQTLEEKKNLLVLLDETIKSEGLTVLIGSEMGIERMRDISLVVSRYGRGDVPLGTVGIIGPLRMDYSQVIPLVASAANAVSESLSLSEL